MHRDGSKRRTVGVAFAGVVAVALCFGVAQITMPVTALAEDNDPNPKPPKPKDPPTPPPPNDHCAHDRMRTACRNAEAIRNLLREAPPIDPKPAADAGAGAAAVK
jgi:hypothetical protein